MDTRRDEDSLSKVVVHGYTQLFAFNTTVHVFWKGAPVGSVKKGGSISFDIEEDGEVSFKSSLRQASVFVEAGRVTNIKITWNRITGKMVPRVVDAGTPAA